MNLAGAALSDLNLAGADLSHADLSGADLSGANLQGVDFTGATLAGADFTGPWNEGNGLKMVQGQAQPIAEATAGEVRKELQKAVKKSPSAKGNLKKSW